MDPLSALVAAIVAGASIALKDTTSAAVKDAYSALRELITRKFGKKASLDSLEEKPDSKNRRAGVSEDLEEANAHHDAEVLASAKHLVELIKREAPESAKAIGIDLENVSIGFVTVGKIESEGTGLRAHDVRIEGGLTVDHVVAGKDSGKNPT